SGRMFAAGVGGGSPVPHAASDAGYLRDGPPEHAHGEQAAPALLAEYGGGSQSPRRAEPDLTRVPAGGRHHELFAPVTRRRRSGRDGGVGGRAQAIRAWGVQVLRMT